MIAVRNVLIFACALLFGGDLSSAQESAPKTETTTTAQEPPTDLLDGISDVETLRAATERLRKEQKFSTLREKRRDILEKIPRVKGEIEALQTQVSALKTEKADLEQRLEIFDPKEIENEEQRYQVRLESAKKQLEALQKQQPAPVDGAVQSAEDLTGELSPAAMAILDAQQNVDYLTMQLDELRSDKERREAEHNRNQERLKEVESELPKLEGELVRKTAELNELQQQQFLVEDKINVLLIPETARNAFKLYITAAFSILVGFVILGFFVVSWRDETVRRAIFSGQSGIQFLTLFSLVIAIILFGITEVLEGKELAALLGGLSGYILGRVTTAT